MRNVADLGLDPYGYSAMKRQKMEIGHPLLITVTWYDSVPEPPKNIVYEGEVIGWRNSQVIVRVKEYSVVRFWKATGLEVGNTDHQRRGLRVDVSELAKSANPATAGINIPLAIDTEA